MGRGEGVYLTKFCFYDRMRHRTPGAPLTYFNDGVGWGGGGDGQRFIFYTQKIPTSEFVYPKKSLLFLAYPKKSLSVFASANFIICLCESYNMPTSTLVLVKKKSINCTYVIFELSWWKIQYPKKSLCCFREPKKSFGPPLGTAPQSELLPSLCGRTLNFFLSFFVLDTIARDCETKIKPVWRHDKTFAWIL